MSLHWSAARTWPGDVFEVDAIEHVLARAQPADFRAGAETGLMRRKGAADAASVAEVGSRRVLDDEARRPIDVRPDDGPIGARRTGGHAVINPRPIAIGADDRRRLGERAGADCQPAAQITKELAPSHVQNRYLMPSCTMRPSSALVI